VYSTFQNQFIGHRISHARMPNLFEKTDSSRKWRKKTVSQKDCTYFFVKTIALFLSNIFRYQSMGYRISHSRMPNLFGKTRGRVEWPGCVFTKGLHRFRCEKIFPTKGRNHFFAARIGLSGDFYGLGMVVLQIKEKAPVLAHTVAKHAP
jgi:hypothetical protein